MIREWVRKERFRRRRAAAGIGHGATFGKGLAKLCFWGRSEKKRSVFYLAGRCEWYNVAIASSESALLKMVNALNAVAS